MSGYCADAREAEVLAYLDGLGIAYERFEHEPAVTMERCAALRELTGAPHCKNLFLTNRNRTEYYLVIMDGAKRFRTADISKQLGASRLSFASDCALRDKLNADAGAITPLALLYDARREVRVAVDEDVLRLERVCVHPMSAASSLRLATADLTCAIESLGYVICHILPQ
ncbi:MAG: prolyl-tRNA synthetase associated domain-containing protein [Clostridia bacterium]|nr:prolyl-tRNA synthetase associated domain-containing protein [Clostridia bacterium]